MILTEPCPLCDGSEQSFSLQLLLSEEYNILGYQQPTTKHVLHEIRNIILIGKRLKEPIFSKGLQSLYNIFR